MLRFWLRYRESFSSDESNNQAPPFRYPCSIDQQSTNKKVINSGCSDLPIRLINNHSNKRTRVDDIGIGDFPLESRSTCIQLAIKPCRRYYGPSMLLYAGNLCSENVH